MPPCVSVAITASPMLRKVVPSEASARSAARRARRSASRLWARSSAWAQCAVKVSTKERSSGEKRRGWKNPMPSRPTARPSAMSGTLQ